MKKIITVILVAVLLITTAVPSYAALPETVVPNYANTSQASVSFVISDNGEASWTIMCIGKSSCVGIDAVTYIEFQTGNSWVRIGLGNGSTQHAYSTTDSYLIQSNKIMLTGKGTYRAVVVFTVYGTSENETLTYWNTHSF